MQKLAICATMRNESRYVHDWLSYHYIVGVRRFFIYNNNSSDDTVAAVERWPRADLVTLIHWPYIPGQIEAYRHFITTHRNAAEWCAFIDGDEFLCPQTEMPIADVLNRLPADCGGLYAHWLMFGSSGQRNYEAAPVPTRFLQRGYNDFGPNCIGKTIVRMASVDRPQNPHVIRCAGRLLNDSGGVIDQDGSGTHSPSSHRLVALNHYFTKSREEWDARRSLGKADKNLTDQDFRRADEEFSLHDVNNVRDLRAAEIMERAWGVFL